MWGALGAVERFEMGRRMKGEEEERGIEEERRERQ